jgi:SAM-dependent methyltransferase
MSPNAQIDRPDLPRLYTELASWMPLMSGPHDYVEEAAWFSRAIAEAARRPVRDVLELGCGGGNNASHLKHCYAMTLTDLSPAMLEVSRALNAECEHVVGDMRTLRLGREFDAVFIHDAVCYLTAEADLQQTFATAFVHCRPGGVVLIAPDYVRETFEPKTDHGGHDGPDGRSLRYLEWAWDPDPTDTSYVVDFAFLLRERNGDTRLVGDRHIHGLFPRATWVSRLSAAGFRAQIVVDDWKHDIFLGVRPA